MIREAILKALTREPMIALNLKAKNDGQGWIPDHGASASFASLLPRTSTDYAASVGDGLGSSVLMSPVKWIQRAFPEAILQVEKRGKEEYEPIDDHALVELVNHPNPGYSGNDLFAGTLYSWIFDGNAYWRKVRNGAGRGVNELWYVPHWLVEPKCFKGSGNFIDYYEYRPGGSSTIERILPEDILHFRNGIDPRNTRKGMSLVYSELREIFGDDEAANFTATLLKNMGVPGILWTPEGEAQVDDVEALKAYLKQQLTRDKRGEPLVSSIAAKIQQFGFDPKSMDLSQLRDIAEERICAALGIPSAIVGFGSGLQQTKVGATMRELKSLAWEGCLIPMQKTFALTLTNSLLPDFEANPKGFRVCFDTNSIEALKPNRKEIAEAFNIGIIGGWIKVAEGREAMGLESTPDDEVYLRSLSVIPDDGSGEALAEMRAVPEPVDDEEPPKKRKKATDRESRIIARAPDGTPTREQRELMKRLVRDALSLEQDAEDDYKGFFAAMGKVFHDAALEVLNARKAKVDNEEMAEQILSRVEMELLETDLAKVTGELYVKIAKKTYRTIQETIGLAVNLPDTRAEQILKLGGRRAGLIDLSKQTRKRLFRELTAGREAGEGPVALARRIQDLVPAGPWSTPKMRARVIARTETLHAQRVSTLEAYKDAPNVTSVMVFDNRTGYGDEECEALDGKIVELDEAWGLMEDEHPNGTRSFAPVIGEKALQEIEKSAVTDLVDAQIKSQRETLQLLKDMAASNRDVVESLKEFQDRRVVKTVKRDEQGRITGVVEELA